MTIFSLVEKWIDFEQAYKVAQVCFEECLIEEKPSFELWNKIDQL